MSFASNDPRDGAPGENSLERADIAVAADLAQGRHNPVIRALGTLSNLGDQPPLLTLAGVTTAYGLLSGNRRAASAGARMLASVLVATAVKGALKRMVSRTRPNVLLDEGHYGLVPFGPDEGPWHSFPSGHTAGSVAAARAVARTYPEAAGPAYAAATGIALMQVPRGAHYPIDVAAGAIIGWGAEAAVDRLFGTLPSGPGRSDTFLPKATGKSRIHPMPQAVIFDIDGTLIDTVELHAQAWVEALGHFGIEAAIEDMRLQIGKGGDQLLLGLLPPDLIERRGEEIQAYRSQLFKRDYLPKARAFPGVRALFERIRASDQRIVLASSGKADEVAHYKEIAGIADLIESATLSDDAERSKPFPDIFQAALKRLAPLSPSDAVVVGDTPYDAEAAREARIKSVGVLCGGFSAEGLRAAGCIAVYRDPQDLLAHYDSSPLAGQNPAQNQGPEAPL